jgi:flagellar motor component MotA
MTRDEFIKQYNDIVRHALVFNEKARKEGLLAMEDLLDREKINDRDIFEYGMSFVIDGFDAEVIDEILSNIVQQEKDEQMFLLKTIQKTAVLSMQVGDNPRILYAKLNSYTDLTIKEDEMGKLLMDD